MIFYDSGKKVDGFSVSEVHAGKTPAIFLGDVTWKNGLYWLVNWGSLSSPNGEFLPQRGVKEESAGSCSIDCPKFMFVYAPARILVGWIFPHFGVTPILPGILPTEIWYFPPKTSSGDQLDWSVGQDTAALSGAELASEMTSNGISHHWFLADTEVEVS